MSEQQEPDLNSILKEQEDLISKLMEIQGNARKIEVKHGIDAIALKVYMSPRKKAIMGADLANQFLTQVEAVAKGIPHEELLAYFISEMTTKFVLTASETNTLAKELTNEQ